MRALMRIQTTPMAGWINATIGTGTTNYMTAETEFEARIAGRNKLVEATRQEIATFVKDHKPTGQLPVLNLQELLMKLSQDWMI